MRTDRSRVQVRKVLTYVRVRVNLRNQPRLKDHQAHRNSKGSKQPKARKTGPLPHYVYRWMPQELAVLTCSQRYRQSPGSARRGTQSQPRHSALLKVHGRKVLTYVRVREKLRSQQDLKTTKRTTIARVQSNRKQGRQVHRHTMSIAGCCRSWLS